MPRKSKTETIEEENFEEEFDDSLENAEETSEVQNDSAAENDVESSDDESVSEDESEDHTYEESYEEKKELPGAAVDKDIKNALAENALIIGFDAVVRAVKAGNVAKVFAASNIPKIKHDELKHYCEISDIPFEELSYNNEELGILCKKQYLITVVALKKQ